MARSLLAALAASILLSGCTAGLGPVHEVGHQREMPANLPGITIEAFYNATDGVHVIDAIARNTGTRTYYVITSQAGAWTDTMRGPDGEVEIRNETYTMQCTWKAFHPGDIVRQHWVWKETLYQGQDGQGNENPARPAPHGAYVWTATFTAWQHDTCPYPDDELHADLAFDLVV